MALTTTTDENLLGRFLKDRRARLDPTAFGFDSARRRTPGLRREEVAMRAAVSTTWYTWLEQGRHGAPSADVLDRLADALQLTVFEREHLFLIAQRRTPGVGHEPPAQVTPRLQRMIDSLACSPAIVTSLAWDIVAWNPAASAVLMDYAALTPRERNILRLIFVNPEVRARSTHWEQQARSVVAAFRLQMARGGGADATRDLLDEMLSKSPEFAALWLENDVGPYGEGTKHIIHPIAGPLALEYASFAVDGQPDLSLVIYTAASATDRHQVLSLINDLSR